MLFRDPNKLFTKYLGRVANRKNYRAITKALRTVALSPFRD